MELQTSLARTYTRKGRVGDRSVPPLDMRSPESQPAGVPPVAQSYQNLTTKILAFKKWVRQARSHSLLLQAGILGMERLASTFVSICRVRDGSLRLTSLQSIHPRNSFPAKLEALEEDPSEIAAWRVRVRIEAESASCQL